MSWDVTSSARSTPIPIDVRIDFYRADGSWLGKRDGTETTLPPYGFRQLDQAFGAWGTLADGYAIVKPTTAGLLITTGLGIDALPLIGPVAVK